MKTFKSDISHELFPISEQVAGHSIRPSIMNVIHEDHPSFNKNCSLSISELNLYRQKYIAEVLAMEVGALSNLERTMLTSLADKTTITDKLDKEEAYKPSFGQRLADKVAAFGGSWRFIIFFGSLLLLWIAFNAFFLSNTGFDPYPFILPNLILSCIAALQAPIIMMSQNRQEEKDRERAKKDYMINLKSELEIRGLHEKIDHLIKKQQQELLEMQKVQIEMMDDIMQNLIQRHFHKKVPPNEVLLSK